MKTKSIYSHTQAAPEIDFEATTLDGNYTIAIESFHFRHFFANVRRSTEGVKLTRTIENVWLRAQKTEIIFVRDNLIANAIVRKYNDLQVPGLMFSSLWRCRLHKLIPCQKSQRRQEI